MTITQQRTRRVDERAVGWLSHADQAARRAWEACVSVAADDVGGVGLADGDRPLADIEVLAGAVGACEYALAVRLHAATVGGAVPFPGNGGVLRARGWSGMAARRLERCAALVARVPDLAGPWAAGVVTAEHLDPIAKVADRFTDAELRALAVELAAQWGHWSPALIARLVAAADRMLHPPPDPTLEESDAHASRALSFSITPDSVILAGELPRLEGELVIAAIDRVAERLRSTADHVPAAARRADALVQLVNDAHAAGRLPTRGGLPVGLTVTLHRSELGDALWTTGRGHLLTRSEARWAACDATVTPVLIESSRCTGAADDGDGRSADDRIAALAAALFETRIPLEMGRERRTAPGPAPSARRTGSGMCHPGLRGACRGLPGAPPAGVG